MPNPQDALPHGFTIFKEGTVEAGDLMWWGQTRRWESVGGSIGVKAQLKPEKQFASRNVPKLKPIQPYKTTFADQVKGAW